VVTWRGVRRRLVRRAAVTLGQSPRRRGSYTTRNEENHEMEQIHVHHPSLRHLRRGRVVALALGAAVLPATIVAVAASGAMSSHSARAVVVSSAKSAKYGTILVSGRTVYTLHPSAVACGASCVKYWPEVLLPKGVQHATAGPGVNAAKLGTIKRANGLQVTYAGKALYWFSLDTGKGQVHGVVKDTWGSWSVVVLKARPAVTTTTAKPNVTTTTKPGATTTVPAPTTTVTPTTAPVGGGGGF
jgi:predicted lipoprotein with Yx(FWY)xxD motif